MLEQLLAASGTGAGEDLAWRNAAACLDEDPELFFPEGESERYRAQIEAALGVCSGCAVADPCLAYALDTEQRTGIWGGTTASTRRALEGSVTRGGGRAVGRGGVISAIATSDPTDGGGHDEPDAGLRRAAG